MGEGADTAEVGAAPVDRGEVELGAQLGRGLGFLRAMAAVGYDAAAVGNALGGPALASTAAAGAGESLSESSSSALSHRST